MPENPTPTDPETDSSLNTGETLIARRRPTVKRNFTGTVATGATPAIDGAGEVPPTGTPLARLEQARRAHWSTYKRLMAWSLDRTRLRILRTLVERRLGVTYDTLAENVDVSRRTVKTLVGTLADLGVVERDGNPAQVRFTDEDRYLLTVDATAYEK